MVSTCNISDSERPKNGDTFTNGKKTADKLMSFYPQLVHTDCAEVYRVNVWPEQYRGKSFALVLVLSAPTFVPHH